MDPALNPQSHSPKRRPMEILLVEDSLTFARTTICALRRGRIEHRLTWLQDGEEAAAFLHQQGRFIHAPRPDLILLDLRLPTKDGRELLAEIRADPDLQDLPVVVMTASTADEDEIACERLHVEGYLVKPVDLAKFLRLVSDLERCWGPDVALPIGA